MTSRRPPRDPSELDWRQEEILRSIIQEHVLTGEPIGSRTVSRGTRLDLSPASIRAVMVDLEERGLLRQPHASAGRVPTEQAYRHYVDRMIGQPRIALAQSEEIDRALSAGSGEIAELLGRASKVLSRFSNQVGVVLAPEVRRIVVERVEFVRLDPRRAVAIVVGRSGVVHNRILELAEPLDQAELDRVGRYLSEEFGGRTLPAMRELLQQRVTEEGGAAYDELVARSLELGRRTFEADSGEGELFVDGASNLLGFPEFTDPGTIQTLLRALEEKRTLIDLLSRMLDGGGVQVVIGEENRSSDLEHCSLVASTYGSADRVMGTVGIVGPTRMEYARAIALVDHLARVLTRFFSGADPEGIAPPNAGT